MNLTQELVNLGNQIKAKLPEEVQAAMAKATQDLMNTKIAENILSVGDKIPSFTLPNARGESIEVAKLLENGPLVIAFYRGGWCPYCNLELRGLQHYLPQIQELGASLIAISPETPDNSLSTKEKNELSFEVLSDVENKVAKQFNLVFTLPEELRPIYNSLGIDIPAFNGDESFELPLAATYVVDSNGKIIYAFADADYTKRLDPEKILVALKNLKVAV